MKRGPRRATDHPRPPEEWGGEGKGEGVAKRCARWRHPLTPALSPLKRGRGSSYSSCRDRMVPICQERAQRRNKCQGLVEHDVMLRLRDLHHRRGTAQKVEHVLADLGREQD